MHKPAKDQLRSFIERIERLTEEKQAITDDIKEVFAEAKGNGFDNKALRSIIRMRKEDAEKRAEHEAIVELYMSALGMLPADDEPTESVAKHEEKIAAKAKRKARQPEMAGG